MPTIKLNAPELKQTTGFLIVTGAEINLIHLQTLKPKTMIATHESMAITGITDSAPKACREPAPAHKRHAWIGCPDGARA